jgi:uncharacterized protein YydD (DUF2326 family)
LSSSSGLPARGDKTTSVFDPNEIVLTLHDENGDGRLFRMNSWRSTKTSALLDKKTE